MTDLEKKIGGEPEQTTSSDSFMEKYAFTGLLTGIAMTIGYRMGLGGFVPSVGRMIGYGAVGAVVGLGIDAIKNYKGK